MLFLVLSEEIFVHIKIWVIVVEEDENKLLGVVMNSKYLHR